MPPVKTAPGLLVPDAYRRCRGQRTVCRIRKSIAVKRSTLTRYGDVLRFFKLIDATVSRTLAVDVVQDNLSAHKPREITK
jgi:hypothetical protein